MRKPGETVPKRVTKKGCKKQKTTAKEKKSKGLERNTNQQTSRRGLQEHELGLRMGGGKNEEDREKVGVGGKWNGVDGETPPQLGLKG